MTRCADVVENYPLCMVSSRDVPVAGSVVAAAAEAGG